MEYTAEVLALSSNANLSKRSPRYNRGGQVDTNYHNAAASQRRAPRYLKRKSDAEILGEIENSRHSSLAALQTSNISSKNANVSPCARRIAASEGYLVTLASLQVFSRIFSMLPEKHLSLPDHNSTKKRPTQLK